MNVTVANINGTNIYVINGINKPVLEMNRGNRYIFDLSDVTVINHPLNLKEEDDDSNNLLNGVNISGTAGQDNSIVEFIVQEDTPNVIRYYCVIHGEGMGNIINIT